MGHLSLPNVMSTRHPESLWLVQVMLSLWSLHPTRSQSPGRPRPCLPHCPVLRVTCRGRDEPEAGTLTTLHTEPRLHATVTWCLWNVRRRRRWLSWRPVKERHPRPLCSTWSRLLRFSPHASAQAFSNCAGFALGGPDLPGPRPSTRRGARGLISPHLAPCPAAFLPQHTPLTTTFTLMVFMYFCLLSPIKQFSKLYTPHTF